MSANNEDLSSTIAKTAKGPASASADGVTVSAANLKDQIAADKYLTSRQAAKTNPARALRRIKIIPPGAV